MNPNRTALYLVRVPLKHKSKKREKRKTFCMEIKQNKIITIKNMLYGIMAISLFDFFQPCHEYPNRVSIKQKKIE